VAVEGTPRPIRLLLQGDAQHDPEGLSASKPMESVSLRREWPSETVD
jgi:hypothetical protein